MTKPPILTNRKNLCPSGRFSSDISAPKHFQRWCPEVRPRARGRISRPISVAWIRSASDIVGRWVTAKRIGASLCARIGLGGR